MPRIHVRLSPNTIHFDDGEHPLVSHLARFGEAMSQLPIQLAQIKMQQEHEQNQQDQFDAEHALRMNADQREQQAFHYGNLHSGYEMPHPANDQMLTADEQNDQLIYAEGQEARQADIEARRARSADHWTPMPEDKSGVHTKPALLNTRTSEVRDAYPATDEPFVPTGKPTVPDPDDVGVGYGASHGGFEGMAGAYMPWLSDDGGSAPAAAQPSPFASHGPDSSPDDALQQALAAHDAGDAAPLTNLIVNDPSGQVAQKARAHALMRKSRPAQGTPFDIMRMGR